MAFSTLTEWLVSFARRHRLTSRPRRHWRNSSQCIVPQVIESLESRIVLSADVVNLGVAGGISQINGELGAFVASEEANSKDLNGDGDLLDSVLHVYDFKTQTTMNVGYAVTEHVVGAERIAFRASETNQGVDLNGDGDLTDQVLFIYDHISQTTTNLQIAALSGAQIDGQFVAFGASEFGQQTDYNGDGDFSDVVPFLYDAVSGMLTNVGLAATSIELNGPRLAFSVSESSQGGIDRNGDGDVFDRVLHVFDLNTQETRNLGNHSDNYRFEGDAIAFLVAEQFQGNVDLSRNFESDDNVLFVYEVGTGIMTNTELETRFYEFDGTTAVVSVADNSVDLPNIYVYDGTSHTATNTNLRGLPIFVWEGDRVIVSTPERRVAQDLNGDGDTDDTVLQMLEISSLTATNLGFAGQDAQLSGDFLAFRMRESDQGNVDLNGDGDANDRVLHLMNLVTGELTNFGLAVVSPRFQNDWLVFFVNEIAQGGTDFNGDGQATTAVLHVYDTSTGSLKNFELSGSELTIQGDHVLISVRESSLATDLNGDRDTVDLVFFAIDLGVTRLLNLDGIRQQITDLNLGDGVTGGLLTQLDRIDESLEKDRDSAASAQISAILRQFAALAQSNDLDELSIQTLSDQLEEILAVL